MAKMFYSSEETAAKLNLPDDKIKELVEKNKLREFRDGNRVMFKVDQVDRLASDMQGGSLEEGMIELAPLPVAHYLDSRQLVRLPARRIPDFRCNPPPRQKSR